jgi:hypothetical protein
MPMTITINGDSFPSGWHPAADMYRFDHPEAQATDGNGAPCRAIGKPTAQIGMHVLPRAVFAWLQSLFPDALATSVDVTVTGLFDPRANATGTYTGKMLRPTWDAILSGWRYSEAVVKFVELVET